MCLTVATDDPVVLADSPAPAVPATAGARPGPVIGQFLDGSPSPRTMPDGDGICVRPGHGVDSAGPPVARRQSMRGFEDQYSDIVDYIVRITHRIWEDQDVGYIYDTYAPGCMVYDDSGAHYGVERVVEGTIASIHAFPDTRSFADEVIWAGNDQQGFATSHRYITTGHHLGAWEHGGPTGRQVNLWGIANCVVLENEIVEEWVLYNTASRLSQLGIDVTQAARAYGNRLAEVAAGSRSLPEVSRLAGGRKPVPYESREGPFDPDHFVRALWHDVYNRRDLSAIARAYSPTVRWNGASNRVGYGVQDVQQMARSLLATFPDLGMAVDEVYWMGNAESGYRIAVRWTALGTHRGHGLYGSPTARRVHLWGISHLYVTSGRITSEWAMFNEFDVLAQIVADEAVPLLGPPAEQPDA